MEANWNNSKDVDYEANEKAQKESLYSKRLIEFYPLIICPPSGRRARLHWQIPQGHVGWKGSLQSGQGACEWPGMHILVEACYGDSEPDFRSGCLGLCLMQAVWTSDLSEESICREEVGLRT